MLYRVSDDKLEDALGAYFGGGHPLYCNFLHLARPSHPETPVPAVLTDSLKTPRAIVICDSDWLVGDTKDDGAWVAIMESILLGEGEFPKGFPRRNIWRPKEPAPGIPPGTPYIFLNQCPAAAPEGARKAGFIFPGTEAPFAPSAELWIIEGEPRFAELVKHPCRLGEGEELLPVLKEGWPHSDPEGNYIRQCLRNGPSFVCEEDGEPVSASATHLSRTMGMIHTPEHLRGRGYASSLAAFRADAMLSLDGQATAHIWHDNHPSQAVVKKLGARKAPGYYGWWLAFFPEARWLPASNASL